MTIKIEEEVSEVAIPQEVKKSGNNRDYKKDPQDRLKAIEMMLRGDKHKDIFTSLGRSESWLYNTINRWKEGGEYWWKDKDAAGCQVVKRIEEEFNEPVEDILNDLVKHVDHLGMKYCTYDISQILGVDRETAVLLMRKHGIPLPNGRESHSMISKIRDVCWVKWGVTIEEFIKTHAPYFTYEEMCNKLSCKRAALKFFLKDCEYQKNYFTTGVHSGWAKGKTQWNRYGRRKLPERTLMDFIENPGID